MPEKVRKLKLVSQATRFLRTGPVVGGWIKDDRAVLAVEGEDHSGNTKRGAVFMKKMEAGWEEYASDLVEIPAP